MDDSKNEGEERGITRHNLETWYRDLIEDCQEIITEAVFQSRWALVDGYHQLGMRIRNDKGFTEYAKGNKTSVQDLALKIRTSERTVYYALQFYDKYPSLDKVPEGKNISWNKLITKYLPETTRETQEYENWIECPKCHHRFINQ